VNKSRFLYGRINFALAQTKNCRMVTLAKLVRRIEDRLEAVGLSARGASEKAGLSMSAIRNMQRGVTDGRNGASITTLFALAPVLETTVAWLLRENDGDLVPAAEQEIRLLKNFRRATVEQQEHVERLLRKSPTSKKMQSRQKSRRKT
jgi:transcriptional regulator with XRE-family HTH domain